MNTNQPIHSFLETFSLLLEKEKDALIQNKGKDLQDIVKQKEQFARELEKMTLTEEEHLAVLPLLEHIRTLQETNFLLTQQSIQYVDSFIQSIQREVQKQSNTYSKKGAYESPRDVSFLDQSL